MIGRGFGGEFRVHDKSLGSKNGVAYAGILRGLWRVLVGGQYFLCREQTGYAFVSALLLLRWDGRNHDTECRYLKSLMIDQYTYK